MTTESLQAVLVGLPGEVSAVAADPRILARVHTVWDADLADGTTWLSEGALQAVEWEGAPVWLSPALLEAGGDFNLVRRYAGRVGRALVAAGYAGVWGEPGGALDADRVSWAGPALRQAFRAGFAQAGVRLSVCRGRQETWEMDQGGSAGRWGSGADRVVVSPAEWRASAGTIVSSPESTGASEDMDSLGHIISRLAEQGITLVDDPGHLPLDPGATIEVDDPGLTGAAIGLASSWPDAPSVMPQSRVIVWVDGPGRDPGPHDILVAVACRRLDFIPEMPVQAVKVAVYSPGPEVWCQLRRKLLGQGAWTGRLPEPVSAASPVTRHASHFATEQAHSAPDLRWWEDQPLTQATATLIREEVAALDRLQNAVPELAVVVQRVREALRSGHRLFYIGAGSAGRAGMVDAAEIYPTFGLADSVHAIMAGGPRAFQRAREGVEDDPAKGRKDIQRYGVAAGDIVLALTAHGNTPYVLGAAEEARARGAIVVGLVNNRGTRLESLCHHLIVADSGPEALVGSTRLKAGTVEKVVLNIVSTLAMVGIGKTYDNLMVDFVPSNEKLRERAVRVYMLATGGTRRMAETALEEAAGKLPVAIVASVRKIPTAQARELLVQTGSIKQALLSGKG